MSQPAARQQPESGREAGFAAADELFNAPSDLYRMFCFRA
jgi:hypothetical protein